MTNDLGILGMIAGEQRRFTEAESIFRQVYELGENGFTVAEDAAFGLDRLGMLRLAQGDLAGAESLCAETS